MMVNLWASQGVVAVVDDLDEQSRAVHKYRVVEDRGRRDSMWGVHQSDDLEGVVVEHQQTATISSGHVVNINWQPDPDASRELVERGATVEYDPDTVEHPRGLKA